MVKTLLIVKLSFKTFLKDFMKTYPSFPWLFIFIRVTPAILNHLKFKLSLRIKLKAL